MIFSHSVLPILILWFGVVVWHLIRYHTFKFHKFRFSVGNHYLMMSSFVIGLLLYAYDIHSVKPIIMFFGFALAGISGVIYEELFGKHFLRRRDRKVHWSWFITSFIGLVILITWFFYSRVGINSIYATSIAFVCIAICIIFIRRDLIWDSLLSGILVACVMLLSYLIFLTIFPEAIKRWWFLNNISGILFLGIPIEELLWAFSWGLVGGPIYEFMVGLKFKKR